MTVDTTSPRVLIALELTEQFVEALSVGQNEQKIHERFNKIINEMTAEEKQDYTIIYFARWFYGNDIQKLYDDPEFKGLNKSEITKKISQTWELTTSELKKANAACKKIDKSLGKVVSKLERRNTTIENTRTDLRKQKIDREQLEFLKSWQPTGPVN